MKRFTFVAALAVALAGCVSSSTVGFVDGHVLPPRFAGYSHRAWIEGRTLVIEVDQIPGLNVGLIRYRIVDGNIYLCPVRASSGGPGRDIIRIDLSSESLPSDWQDRIYWLTYEAYYPIGNRAFWCARYRHPSERVRVVVTRSDGKRE
jgi:prepilin-type processing-associated H-X9-DG protein